MQPQVHIHTCLATLCPDMLHHIIIVNANIQSMQAYVLVQDVHVHV